MALRIRKAPSFLVDSSGRSQTRTATTIPTATTKRPQQLPHRRPISSINSHLSKSNINNSSSTPTAAKSSAQQPKDPRSRFQVLNARFPRIVQRWTTPLLNAPVTHITSFLILHEITAVVPLLGLVAAFHYGGWMPQFGILDDNTAGREDDEAAQDSHTQNIFRTSFNQGIQRFGRYLKRKGWVQEEDIDAANSVTHYSSGTVGNAGSTGTVLRQQQGVRLVLEFATAYAITKVLLPLRIAVSVWATPWFARAVLGTVSKGVKRALGR